jgi:hypothetical protein
MQEAYVQAFHEAERGAFDTPSMWGELATGETWREALPGISKNMRYIGFGGAAIILMATTGGAATPWVTSGAIIMTTGATGEIVCEGIQVLTDPTGRNEHVMNMGAALFGMLLGQGGVEPLLQALYSVGASMIIEAVQGK